MILDADTVSYPIAIVFHAEDIAFTVTAVVGARRPYRFALVAVLPSSILIRIWRERVHHFLLNLAPILFA